MTSLVKASDQFIAKHKGTAGFVVVVGDREKLQDQVKKLASEQKLAIPLTFLAGGPSSPDVGRFKLNEDVDYTVMVYNRKRVTSNHAFREIKPEGITAILTAAGAVAPTSGADT